MFHHPNLLTLEDVCSSSSTRGEASEVFLLFDFFPQSLQDLVNKHRCVWTSYLRVRRCRLFVCMFMAMCVYMCVQSDELVTTRGRVFADIRWRV
jgi:hypothetical protein